MFVLRTQPRCDKVVHLCKTYGFLGITTAVMYKIHKAINQKFKARITITTIFYKIIKYLNPYQFKPSPFFFINYIKIIINFLACGVKNVLKLKRWYVSDVIYNCQLTRSKNKNWRKKQGKRSLERNIIESRKKLKGVIKLKRLQIGLNCNDKKWLNICYHQQMHE